TMSEFELHLFRQRSAEAILQKARRGELQFRLPVGLCWTAQGKIEMEADLRMQQAIHLVLDKFRELGSARQVLLAFRRERVIWNAPETDMRLKQRITRILIEEIVADVDEKTNEIVLIIHWAGGRHSELRVAKNKTGHHGHANKVEVLDVVRQMASQYTDQQI